MNGPSQDLSVWQGYEVNFDLSFEDWGRIGSAA